MLFLDAEPSQNMQLGSVDRYFTAMAPAPELLLNQRSGYWAWAAELFPVI